MGAPKPADKPAAAPAANNPTSPTVLLILLFPFCLFRSLPNAFNSKKLATRPTPLLTAAPSLRSVLPVPNWHRCLKSPPPRLFSTPSFLHHLKPHWSCSLLHSLEYRLHPSIASRKRAPTLSSPRNPSAMFLNFETATPPNVGTMTCNE